MHDCSFRNRTEQKMTDEQWQLLATSWFIRLVVAELRWWRWITVKGQATYAQSMPMLARSKPETETAVLFNSAWPDLPSEWAPAQRTGWGKVCWIAGINWRNWWVNEDNDHIHRFFKFAKYKERNWWVMVVSANFSMDISFLFLFFAYFWNRTTELYKVVVNFPRPKQAQNTSSLRASLAHPPHRWSYSYLSPLLTSCWVQNFQALS
jgi:hypothetical protein